MLYRLKKENPTKEFIAGNPNAICPNMKLNNLEKVLWALEDMKFEIEVEETIRKKALSTIEKMVKIWEFHIRSWQIINFDYNYLSLN